MSAPSQVKLIFVDGPLEGQTRFVSIEDLTRNRIYRVLVPNKFTAQTSSDTRANEVRVTATQVDYIHFSVPSSYGTERFIMCQQNAGLGN